MIITESQLREIIEEETIIYMILNEGALNEALLKKGIRLDEGKLRDAIGKIKAFAKRKAGVTISAAIAAAIFLHSVLPGQQQEVLNQLEQAGLSQDTIAQVEQEATEVMEKIPEIERLAVELPAEETPSAPPEGLAPRPQEGESHTAFIARIVHALKAAYAGIGDSGITTEEIANDWFADPQLSPTEMAEELEMLAPDMSKADRGQLAYDIEDMRTYIDHMRASKAAVSPENPEGKVRYVPAPIPKQMQIPAGERAPSTRIA
jgi:hypothetical protein